MLPHKNGKENLRRIKLAVIWIVQQVRGVVCPRGTNGEGQLATWIVSSIEYI